MKEDLHVTEKLKETSIISDEEFRAVLAAAADIKTEEDGDDPALSSALPDVLEELGHTYGFSPHDGAFKFPACQVSRHVFGIMALVRSALEEACEAADARLAVRLVNACKLVFQLYA